MNERQHVGDDLGHGGLLDATEVNDFAAYRLQRRLVLFKNGRCAADEHRDLASLGAMHPARDRAGERIDLRGGGASRERLDLGEIIGAHLDPGRAPAHRGQRLIHHHRGRLRRGQAGDQRVTGPGEFRNGSSPGSAGGEYASRRGPIQIMYRHFKSAAHQIRGEVLAEVTEANKPISHK